MELEKCENAPKCSSEMQKKCGELDEVKSANERMRKNKIKINLHTYSSK